jgi:hypothetical protein
MNTTYSNITKDMTPVEAANLLVQLEEGHEAAWLSTRELSWQSPEYVSRFQNAAEIDGVFRDVLRETIDNGMRHPGEPVEEFAERAESDAWLTEALEAGADTTPDPTIQQVGAGLMPERLDNQDDIAARPLNDVKAPESQAYARAFSAAAPAREPREQALRPEPDRTPGAPHPDPFLASRGWHVNEHGLYTRRPRPDPQPQARPGHELEAG